MRYIWIQGRKYYHYNTYNSWQEAKKVAQWQRKKNRSRYYIIKGEEGFMFPCTKYKLYLDKVIALKMW